MAKFLPDKKSPHEISEWLIRRPCLFRYLEKQYVDLFFSEGILRLSSFSAFSQHKDEERLDTQEGRGSLYNADHEGEGQYIFSVMSQGHDCYVLCGSQVYSKSLAQQFFPDSDVVSGFRINDTTAFGVKLADAIPSFKGGLEGPCIYNDGLIMRKAGRIEYRTVHPDGKETADLNKLHSGLYRATGSDLFFVKSKKYQHQLEYRLLWAVREKVSDYIDVKCQEAVQYCTRFEDVVG
jgi:hypothetical protein